ncbi:MAG: nucleotidyltransferase domain-containing protein [Clostridia bacterium]|nr:nucleotidyltransferase domain-containing protein [Clostridia bacterium]
MDFRSNLQTVVEIAKNIVPLKAAYLFGSYAYGQPSKHSDFDIYFVADFIDGSKHDTLVALYGAIHGIAEKPTDILLNTKMHFDERKNYKGTIEYKVAKDGVKLYEQEIIQ